jgi:hypothetical protein
MRENRYPGACVYCKDPVLARGGTLWYRHGFWRVAHLACRENGPPGDHAQVQLGNRSDAQRQRPL